jgi:hypothetical protein
LHQRRLAAVLIVQGANTVYHRVSGASALTQVTEILAQLESVVILLRLSGLDCHLHLPPPAGPPFVGLYLKPPSSGGFV